MGKSIAERKAELAREIAELEILENQENIRNEIAKKIELKERLFISLKNQPTVCRMPLNSDARFKVVYQSEICNKDQCFFANTCEEIAALNGKKGKRKSITGTQGKVNKVYYKREVSNGVITLAKGNDVLTFTDSNWASCTKQIREYFKVNAIEGLTTSAIAGFTHKGKGNKWEDVFNG